MADLVNVELPETNPYGKVGVTTGGTVSAADQTTQPGPTPKRKYAGKFDSDAELEKGYENQQTVLTQRTNELEAERTVRMELERMLASVAERMSPADRVRQRSSSEEALASQGLPLDALVDVIDNRINQRAPKILDDKLAPLTQGAQTREMLASEFPDIDPNDVDQFLRGNPDVKRQFDAKMRQGDIGQAMYFAYGKFAQNQTGQDLSGQTVQAAQARRDAALPSQTTSEVRGQEEGPTLADLYDNYLTRGEKTPFLVRRLIEAGVIKAPEPR